MGGVPPSGSPSSLTLTPRRRARFTWKRGSSRPANAPRRPRFRMPTLIRAARLFPGQPLARRSPVRLLTKIHDASHDGVNTEGVI
jgi:hypothetical protein